MTDIRSGQSSGIDICLRNRQYCINSYVGWQLSSRLSRLIMNHNKKRRALKWFTTLTLIILQSPVFAQNATNFECKDCAENSHSLFAELDQGKVIVIT